jgi:hypothetical protein
MHVTALEVEDRVLLVVVGTLGHRRHVYRR